MGQQVPTNALLVSCSLDECQISSAVSTALRTHELRGDPESQWRSAVGTAICAKPLVRWMYGDWMDSAGSPCGRFCQECAGVDARFSVFLRRTRLWLCFCSLSWGMERRFEAHVRKGPVETPWRNKPIWHDVEHRCLRRSRLLLGESELRCRSADRRTYGRRRAGFRTGTLQTDFERQETKITRQDAAIRRISTSS